MKQNKTKPVFGNRPYKCSDGVENIAETNFHKKIPPVLKSSYLRKILSFRSLKRTWWANLPTGKHEHGCENQLWVWWGCIEMGEVLTPSGEKQSQIIPKNHFNL